MVCGSAFSFSAIERGRMLSSRVSARSCASWRCWAKTASSKNATPPATTTFSASIVLLNHPGSGPAGHSSPAMPEARNTSREQDEPADGGSDGAEHQRAHRAEAPQPHRPGRRKPPPVGYIEMVGARVMSSSWMPAAGTPNPGHGENRRDATETAKYP